jgi:tetratricopeptide (TPR) repeat protein
VIPVVAALVLATVDPCAPVGAAGAPDPETAAAYLEIGEEELARGSRDAAAAAFRAAAEADPGDERPRAALRTLCDAAPADPLARGLRLMDAGELRGAAEAFREARAARPSPSAALLEGICRYELGEDAAAVAALREAEVHPPHRAEASFYLGLLALRAGERERAVALLDAARASPALEVPADELARAARLGGRVVLSLAAEAGWDSNVNLAPTGDPALVPEGDTIAALRAAALIRPWGAGAPYVRAAGLLHEPVDLRDFALRGYDAAAGWRGGSRRVDALVEVAHGARTFGGDPYLTFDRLLASASLLGRRGAIGGTGFVRLESYASGWSGFEGTVAGGELRAAWLAGPRVRLSVAYGVARDWAADEVLSYLEHGPRADVRVAPSRRWRLGADAALTSRRHDAYDPALGQTRHDTTLDAIAWVERDLAGGWALRLSGALRAASSNVATFDYVQVAPAIGLVWARGFL